MGEYTFGYQDAESIAQVMGRTVKTPLNTDWVTITKPGRAGLRKITVMYEDVMANVIPHVDNLTPTTLASPFVAGVRPDRTVKEISLRGHARLVGGSTSGKSSLLHRIIAHLTRGAGLVWYGGNQKVYDFLAGWLEPYADLDLKPPIDFAVFGVQDTCEMLAAAMRIGRFRQNLDMHERGGRPPIFVILDESSYVLGDHQTTAVLNGVSYNASQLLGMFNAGITSAQMYSINATQLDVDAQSGDKGNLINAQMAWQAVFAIEDEGAVGRMAKNYGVPMPRHRGEMWLRETIGGAGLDRLKVPYIQSIDPTAELLLPNGPTVADVSWARRHFADSWTLDAEETRAAGEVYASRFVRMTADYKAYLKGRSPSLSARVRSPITITRPPAPQENPTANPSGDPELIATVNQLAALGVELPDILKPYVTAEPEQFLDSPQDDELAARRNRMERIEDIVRGQDAPIGRAAIIERLTEQEGRKPNPNVVSNALSTLVERGRLIRSEAADPEQCGYMIPTSATVSGG